MLHTVASYAMDRKVAARLARAHVALRRAGHTHRVALAIEVCLHHEICSEADVLYSRRTDDQAMSTIKAAVAQAMGVATTNELPGSSELVQRVGREDVKRAFPRLFSKQSQGVRWADRRRPKWLSNGCDLIGLSWLALYGEAWTPHAHVWVLQHDVGWSADLAAILSANGVFNSQMVRLGPAMLPDHEAVLASPDLVCLGLGEHPQFNSSWAHSAARNSIHQQKYARQASCLLPAARYSRRLVLYLLEELRAGLTTYCEARAATACAAQSWCIAAELRGSGLLGPFSYFTLLNESSEVDSHRGECTQGVGRLFHRVS